MNREDILAKAQQEGKELDLPDLEAQKSGGFTAYVVGFSLFILVAVVNRIVLNYFDYGVYFALLSMPFVLFLTKYRRLRKKHELLLTIFFGFGAFLMLVAWILHLAGVL